MHREFPSSSWLTGGPRPRVVCKYKTGQSWDHRQRVSVSKVNWKVGPCKYTAKISISLQVIPDLWPTFLKMLSKLPRNAKADFYLLTYKGSQREYCQSSEFAEWLSCWVKLIRSTNRSVSKSFTKSKDQRFSLEQGANEHVTSLIVWRSALVRFVSYTSVI